jgi:hypothetical protein
VNLAILALRNRDLDERVLVVFTNDVDLGRPRLLAVIQRHTRTQQIEPLAVERTFDLRVIDLRHTPRWMEQRLGHRAIIRE